MITLCLQMGVTVLALGRFPADDFLAFGALPLLGVWPGRRQRQHQNQWDDWREHCREKKPSESEASTRAREHANDHGEGQPKQEDFHSKTHGCVVQGDGTRLQEIATDGGSNRANRQLHFTHHEVDRGLAPPDRAAVAGPTVDPGLMHRASRLRA